MNTNNKCKKGVIKTHKLTLMTTASLLTPGASENTTQSTVSIGPKAIREMVDHFPLGKGGKLDPQLVWTFGEVDVGLRTTESSMDARGE